ncbi:MAG: SDR family NAD(P)-dependent oxidoreductase [Candidatus Delongbacteria bacterium]|nr:SDR family NAD(P)-dependent oxidoreductase [Candidatus Delongbacteria bacterium]MBN2834323.1 SDR family NAD(P)-dependent oxidoreductase [Candidatus Delongbacteria bacterium]
MESMKNKIVFISGASSGIGKACAEIFAENECRLIICSRRFNVMEEIATDLKNKYGTEVLPLVLDVSNRKEVVEKIGSLPDDWRNVDILINNAGGALGMEKFQNGNFADWDQMIDTNVKGVLYLSRLLLPRMIENNSGHIINIGSIAGTAAYPNGAVYCAAKSAVKLISDGIRIDTVDTKIRVTNIQPGLVETNFSVVRFHGDEEKAANVYKGIESLTAEDIADLVLYIASVPSRVQICEVTVTPNNQANATSVFRI